MPPPAAGSTTAWQLTSTTFTNTFSAMPYVGNGYFSQRIPPAGAGLLTGLGTGVWPLEQPRDTQAIVAGIYAEGRFSRVYPDESKRVLALIPTWSSLTFASPSGEYSPETAAARNVADYRQVLDLRAGTVTTSGTWTAPGGEQTGYRYRVFADRARKHVGVVTLELTPRWTGLARVTSLIDGAGALRLEPVDAAVDTASHRVRVVTRTSGSGVTIGETAVLAVSGATPVADEPVDRERPMTAGERIGVRVEAGRTYTFAKYVGVVTSRDADDPAGEADREATDAAALGADALARESRASWDEVWTGDIEVAGDPVLQRVVRAGIYNLYASMRADSPGVIGPSGLSSDDYAGMAFWDADIWMFPALLATHPDVARTIVDYRADTLAAAKQNAAANGYRGAFYPWTAADDGHIAADCYGTIADAGDRIISDPNRSCSQELHLQADVALAQWQYFEATGDRQWLARRGYPVLEAVADFWVSKAVPAAGGGYAINDVQPPDEDHPNVNNSAYTNAAAAEAIRHAIEAARLLGRPVPPAWPAVADGIARTIPFDPVRRIHLEYDEYRGAIVKQADVVLMTYPLEYPMPADVARADIDYYVPRTNPNGPAMTDAIHSIATSALDVPGCAAYTFLLRSYHPQLRAPFFQTSETAGGGAMNFLTGTGGILQQFLYGFTGLRDGEDAITLDPSLPPQLGDLVFHGLHWQGRTFTVRVGRTGTRVTLDAGAALPIRTPAGRRTVPPGGTITLDTRTPDRQPTRNAARCRPVTASSAAPADPAVAAVDGSIATTWMPTAPAATFTVHLDAPVRLGAIDVTRGATSPFAYTVQMSSDGVTWRDVGTAPASAADGRDHVAVPRGAGAARDVRLVFAGGAGAATPRIAEVSVVPAS